MSTKKKWTLFLIFALFVVALSTSCDSQGKTPAGESEEDTTPLTSESLSQGVLDINYISNFQGLLGLLNGFIELNFPQDGERPSDGNFSLVVGKDEIKLGTITYDSYVSADEYSYNASFEPIENETALGGMVTYTIAGTSDVAYEKLSTDESYFSLSLPDNSTCKIDVLMSLDQNTSPTTMLSAILDNSCTVTSSGITVEDRTYDNSEAKLFGIIDEVVSAAIEYKTSNATTEMPIDDVTVTCTYNSETSTFRGSWSDESGEHSVEVEITPGDSGNNTLVSATYDNIPLNDEAIREFKEPSFSGSLMQI